MSMLCTQDLTEQKWLKDLKIKDIIKFKENVNHQYINKIAGKQ